jgi:hypothetical protein
MWLYESVVAVWNILVETVAGLTVARAPVRPAGEAPAVESQRPRS